MTSSIAFLVIGGVLFCHNPTLLTSKRIHDNAHKKSSYVRNGIPVNCKSAPHYFKRNEDRINIRKGQYCEHLFYPFSLLCAVWCPKVSSHHWQSCKKIPYIRYSTMRGALICKPTINFSMICQKL